MVRYSTGTILVRIVMTLWSNYDAVLQYRYRSSLLQNVTYRSNVRYPTQVAGELVEVENCSILCMDLLVERMEPVI
jgi:hypothetical protein